MSHWTARHASAIIIALLADTRGSCDFGRAADPFLAWAASWTEPAVARLPSEELYCALYLYFWTARYSRKSSRRSARGCCVQLYSVWACYSCTGYRGISQRFYLGMVDAALVLIVSTIYSIALVSSLS